MPIEVTITGLKGVAAALKGVDINAMIQNAIGRSIDALEIMMFLSEFTGVEADTIHVAARKKSETTGAYLDDVLRAWENTAKQGGRIPEIDWPRKEAPKGIIHG